MTHKISPGALNGSESTGTRQYAQNMPYGNKAARLVLLKLGERKNRQIKKQVGIKLSFTVLTE
jgi:hypothetical protein